ncbi:heavy-metal-associated domain-containing protein [Virgibacillus sp. DJP39]|uniref:heavy-metal-associated domain-containing protein n=1 Tax=Virgibacillus sp. DJP39 TaxID=3409790 RepID=UPI003BB53AFB
MKTIKFQLEPLTCPSCINKIEGKLKKMNGVADAKVLFNSSRVKVQFDELLIDSIKIEETIIKLGYPVFLSSIVDSKKRDNPLLEQRMTR